MPRVLLSALARADLIDIWSYVADERSATTADRLLAGILERIDFAASTPRAARVRTEFQDRPRSLSHYPYVIFFEPLEDGDGIAVWRVLHGARQLGDLLTRPTRFD
jgi:plasmid stabilization system protein ParE